jgi:4-hydroxybenzoate polyprenyltransferase
MRSAGRIPGYLAVWAGVYVAGAVVCCTQVAGLGIELSTGVWVRGLACATCTAMAVYLLDRVKLRDAWLDPADAAAHPQRYAFVAMRSPWIRVGIVLLLAGGAVLGASLVWWAGVMPVIACAGVLVYAGRPRGARARVKDVLVLKNAVVACAIAGFAMLTVAAMAVAASGGGVFVASVRERWMAVCVSVVHLAVRVGADAALCDLDDEHADRLHGTGTLPARLGREHAWNVAMVVRLVIAVAIAAAPMAPVRARLAWAGVTVLSSVALRVMAPARVRDWVDARLGVEAAVVSVVLGVWS